MPLSFSSFIAQIVCRYMFTAECEIGIKKYKFQKYKYKKALIYPDLSNTGGHGNALYITMI